MTDFVKVAQTLIDNGFSVIPTGANKVCTLGSWKPYQNNLMTANEIKQYFAKADRVAVIGGKVSGNLECLDFDDPTAYAPFLELLVEHDPALAASLVKRKTPSGGYHLIYRCTEPVAGNLKLAMMPGVDEHGKPKEDVIIETRGEGGYFLTAPSPGYEVIEHRIIDTQTITPAQVETIHALARMFDLRQQQAEQAPYAGKANDGKPGSDYNTRHTVADTLTLYSWQEAKRSTLGTGWTRPGKDSGTSGVLLDNTGNFYCWSSNAFPLEAGKSYSSFAIYTAYEHNGDYMAAARTLAGQGYGIPQTQIKTNSVEEWEPTSPDWPVMDSRAYHGIAADFIDLATRSSEADPAAILATFLVRFGVECSSGAFMHVGDSRHMVRLASVVVGASSKARKGTSGKPVAKLFKLTNMEDQPPLLMARVSKGPFSSGEGIIHAIRDAVKKWNTRDQVEEIVDPGVEDKRLFVLDEEFGGVLANTKREGNTLSMIIRQAWDSGDFDPLIKNNKTTATGGHVGWVSHITLQELHSKLDESEGFNGFANRILWVCAKRQKLVALPEPMPQNELAKIQRHLADILRCVGQGTEIKLGVLAREAWQDQYYADLTKDRPGLVGCVTNRGEAQALRLAMIYCLLDGETIITLDHLHAGLAFWDYCRQSANYIFHGRQTDTTAQTILDELNKGPLTGTEINRLFNSHVPKARLESAMSGLLASGRVEKVIEPTSGRPATKYKLSGAKSVLSVISPKQEEQPPIFTHNTLNTQRDLPKLEVFDI